MLLGDDGRSGRVSPTESPTAAPAASTPTARHFCGEAHAQVYISRWFESICSPPKQVFRIS